VLCLAVSFGAAQAEMKVSGHAPHAAFWRKIYNSLPEQWKTTRLVIVEEVSAAELKRIEAADSRFDSPEEDEDDTDIDGCYQNGGEKQPVRIFLRETLRGEEAALVFLHEYGHYVWDELLTRSQQRAYVRLWHEQKRTERLITDYAETSPEEGFGEAFSYFLRQPNALRRVDARSARFLQTLLEP
jgi:hypothetical protein